MVYFSRQAKIDLELIFKGIISWEKHSITIEHVERYIDDISDSANNLSTKTKHQNCIYPSHKQYGDKFFRYRRNKNTIWYLIYNVDFYGNIFIEKIISNYLTETEIH